MFDSFDLVVAVNYWKKNLKKLNRYIFKDTMYRVSLSVVNYYDNRVYITLWQQQMLFQQNLIFILKSYYTKKKIIFYVWTFKNVLLKVKTITTLCKRIIYRTTSDSHSYTKDMSIITRLVRYIYIYSVGQKKWENGHVTKNDLLRQK